MSHRPREGHRAAFPGLDSDGADGTAAAGDLGDRLGAVTEASTESDPGPRIAVIGGSGFYEFLANAQNVAVRTPYGDPSAPVSIGELGGRPVAFIPRHGRRHEFPPHTVNYRANMWALRSLGVRQILAPCAVGSLQPNLDPGALVVPDQLVDRTSGRLQTFYDQGAVHVAFADPYCPVLRAALVSTSPRIFDGGTMVVVEGPRFSTRAESEWFASLGWAVVNMTGHPEAVLARELALCYATIALVTDRDASASEGERVSQASVLAEFAANLGRLRHLLELAVTRLPTDRSGCSCGSALDGMSLPGELP